MSLKFAYFLAVATVLLFTSCGDKEEDKALVFINTEFEDSFKMYVGSESGGIEIKTDTLKVSSYFPSYSPIYEAYNNTVISFLNENKIVVALQQSSVRPEESLCKFEEGALYISNGGEWQYFADGDKQNLAVRQHYIACKRGEEAFRFSQAAPRRDVTPEIAAAEVVFGSLANMALSTDTLIWCTRRSIFKK